MPVSKKKITKDAKIDVRVPKHTRKQADELALKKKLSLSTYLQLLLDAEYKKLKA